MPGRTRRAIIAAATAVLVAAVAVIVWRVLRPSEVVTPATAAFPAQMFPGPGARGVLTSAPLILDNRLRIFAKEREVWSDGPASYHYERSAYWAYRRWPAQVTGVLLVDPPDPGRPIVVTAWSDGMLAAIDAEKGTVAWRAHGDPLAGSFTGRRTGAATVYTPPGLFISGPRVVTVSQTIRGYQSESGEKLWEIASPIPAECRGTAFTNQAQLLVLDTCAQNVVRINTATGESLSTLPASEAEPVSCTVGHSHCAAMRLTKDDRTTGWILTDSEPPAAKLLAKPAATLAGPDIVLIPSPDSLAAVDLGTGQTLWSYRPPDPGPFRLLAADAAHTLILEPGGSMAALDSTSGALLIRTSILMKQEPKTSYAVSYVYTSGTHITLTRTNPDVPPSASDDDYFFTHRPVLLAHTGLSE